VVGSLDLEQAAPQLQQLKTSFERFLVLHDIQGEWTSQQRYK
jgi:hypothetical protein